MHELDIDDFTKFVVSTIDSLGNVILSNPDDKEQFPSIVVSNPMKSIKITEDNIPVLTRFSISIESWTNSKYDSMGMFEQISKLLRQYNFVYVGSPIDMYDEITKKYRYGGRYEVNYNGLTNSFEKIK